MLIVVAIRIIRILIIMIMIIMSEFRLWELA